MIRSGILKNINNGNDDYETYDVIIFYKPLFIHIS